MITDKRFLAPLLAIALAAPILCASGSARAQGAPANGFGLGLELGTFDGITGKWFIAGQRQHALQFGLDWGYYDTAYAHHVEVATVDYLWHPSTLLQSSVLRLGWYVGLGGALGFGDNYYYWNNQVYHSSAALAGRVPVGLDLLFNQEPFEVYFQIVPTLYLTPFSGFDFWGAIGGRFYF